jgi:alpha-ribazole phosphatase
MSFVGLLRHGETKGGKIYRGWKDDPLTATGWKQMKSSTARLTQWDRIISSPLQRCSCFAKRFAQTHAIPYQEEAKLMEINFGEWEGLRAEEIIKTSPTALYNFWSDPLIHSPPGGESLSHFQSRVVEAWERLSEHYLGQKLLLVTHAGVIRILLSQLQQTALDRLFEIDVKHAAVFGLQLQGGNLELLLSSAKAIETHLNQKPS